MINQTLTILITILGLFFLPAVVFAQTDQEIAQKYGITFPIADLENCASIDECKTFCDNPDNQQKCSDFAQEHNLNTGSTDSTSKTDEEILELAKAELGCSSMDECMAFCNKEENMEKCMDFAVRHSLGGGNADQMKQIISSLKQQLGCSSMTSCMDACSQPENSQKCMEIFQQAGFDTGEGSYSNEPPEVWCPKISSECRWDGAQCVCDGPQTCSKSPGCSWNGQFCNCGGASNITQESPEVWCPKAAQTGQVCSWDGSSCTCWDPDACEKESGCSWTGTKCECNAEEPPEVWCPKNPGCSWDGNQCICSGITTESSDQIYASPEPPEVWCPKNPGCNWTGETCLCEAVVAPQTGEQTPSPTVQGITTNKGLLQQILDFLLGR